MKPDSPTLAKLPNPAQLLTAPPKRLRAALRPASLLFFLAAPLVALLVYEGFARASLAEVLGWMLQRPMMFLLNYGLFASVLWLLGALRSARGRACAAVLLIFLLGAVGIVNYYKVHYRLEPVLFTDVFQLGSMRTTLQEFPMGVRWPAIIGLGLAALLALIGCFTLVPRGSGKRLAPWPLLGVSVFCLAFPFCTFQNVFAKDQTDLVEYARAGGGLFTMVATERLRGSMAYSGYEPENARAAYRELERLAPSDAGDTPNIIFILSESFVDEEYLSPYLHFTEPITPFFSQLSRACVSGDLYVPKQGGGTSETEFEVLTGLHSAYSINPYSAGLPELRSVAAVLRERGYKATALHWHTAVFYNRFKNLRQLGFDEFHTIDTTVSPFQKLGAYVSDAEHYRSIAKTLRDTPEKDFIYCISMQNHFPYAHQQDFAQGRAAPFSNLLSDQSMLGATNYCYLLQHSDHALRDFIAELSSFEEPTLVVFFGDHIPPLGNDFYEEIGMPVKTDMGHLTPYFIWSNTGSAPPQTVNLQAWQLGPFALAQAGITADPFFHHVEALRQSGEDEDEAYRLLTYDALYGQQAAYEGLAFPILSDRWQSGGEMKLLRVDAELLGDRVYILPHLESGSQAFRLSVNGQLLDDWCIPPTEEPLRIECVLTNSQGVMYNHSNALVFSSTNDLLTRTDRIPKTVVSLDQEEYTVTRPSGGYLVAATGRRYAAQSCVLLLDGQRQDLQPAYAVNQAGRFFMPTGSAFKPALPVSIAIPQSAPYGMTSEGIRQYMKDHQAELILLGAYATAP